MGDWVQTDPRFILSINKTMKKPTTRYSFGVRFTRAKYINQVKGKNGWEDKPGETVVSDRRFKTPVEAFQHAKRFTRIERHKGFEVIVSTKAANACINWRTGKTNPLIGLKRTNRR
jgi:hypothetical protein